MKFRVISLILLLCLALCACNSASDPVVTDPTNTPSATEPQAIDPEPAVQITDPDTGIPSLTVTPEGTGNPEDALDDIWGEFWEGGGIVLPEDEFSDEDMSPMQTTPTTEPADSGEDLPANPESGEDPTEVTTPPTTEAAQNNGGEATLPEDVFED